MQARKTMMAAVLAGVLAAGLPMAAIAALTPINGKLVGTAADPDDFVIELDTAGPCGSKYFHIQRTRKNFREVVAVAMLAASGSSRQMLLWVESCAADRNILSHGAYFP